MAEYSPELEMLTNVFDRLGDLIQATIAAQGGKAPKVRPYPRPKTALDRVKEQRRLAKHRRIVARVLPQQAGTPAPATPPPPPPPDRPDRPPLLPGEDPFSFVPGRHR
jgi:hypothetical protein